MIPNIQLVQKKCIISVNLHNKPPLSLLGTAAAIPSLTLTIGCPFIKDKVIHKSLALAFKEWYNISHETQDFRRFTHEYVYHRNACHTDCFDHCMYCTVFSWQKSREEAGRTAGAVSRRSSDRIHAYH